MATFFDVCVIGGGMIGLCVAVRLSEEGYSVVLVDSDKRSNGAASIGNAGQIIPGLIEPIASPDLIGNFFKILFSKHSPLILRKEYVLKAVPWLSQFAISMRPSKFKRSVKALTSINQFAYESTKDFFIRAGIEDKLVFPGLISVFDSEASMEKGLRRWESVPEYLRGSLKILNKGEILELEPNIGRSVCGGFFIEQAGSLTDIDEVLFGIRRYCKELGIQQISGLVADTKENGGVWQCFLQDKTKLTSKKVVIAAGIWSKKILEGHNVSVNLEAERGYNLTVDTKKTVINHPILFSDYGVVATQFTSKLRIGGFDEIAGIKSGPDPAVFKRLVALSGNLIPGMKWATASQWMGFRPSRPDSLPVITRVDQKPNLFCACGHGHVGMTQATVTADLLVDLIIGNRSLIDMKPFCL